MEKCRRAGKSRIRDRFLGRPQSRMHHFDALDGLRGLAVLVVIASHLSNVGLLPQPGLSGTGKAGVYLFFVLSAFLLTRILLARSLRALADLRFWADYLLRRVLRIWPLYLCVLLLSWALTQAGIAWHYRLDDVALERHLLLAEGQSVLWSIPVEFTFYFWLPPLVLAGAWLRTRCPVWGQVLLACGLMAAVMWRWPPSSVAVNDIRVGPYLPVFLCGVFAAHIDAALARHANRWSAAWVGLALLSVGGCVLMVPAIWALLTGTGFQAALNHSWFLAHGLAWGALLLALLHGPAWLRAPFTSVPLRLIGVVSFSAYLWHMPILELVQASGVSRWPGAALVLSLTLAVSMVSFLLLERPWRDVRLTSHRPGQAPG